MKQPRSKNLTPLGKYLWENRITDNEFAALMCKKLGLEKFRSTTVENWRYGRATPKGENIIAIRDITGMTTDQILGLEAA